MASIVTLERVRVTLFLMNISGSYTYAGGRMNIPCCRIAARSSQRANSEDRLRVMKSLHARRKERGG